MSILKFKPKQKENKLQYLNSFYYGPTYNKQFKELYGETVNDFLVIVYRNEDTDEKKLKIIPNPSIQFFVANEDVDIDYHLNQIELDNVHLEKVSNKHVLKYLCQLQDEENGTNTDFTKFYKTGKPGPTKFEANKFHKFDRVFASDINIEDYFKGKFLDTYTKASYSKITKSYTDIEVDSIDIIGFPNEDDALCPVNALTCFFDEKMTFYTLLLRNENNPLIEKLEKNLTPFKKKLKKMFGKEFKFAIKFFDDELDLISYYFQLNNAIKPDFNLIWNMQFDINTLLNRIGHLEGFNREDRERFRRYDFQDVCAEYCCSTDFPDYLRRAKYLKDRKNIKASEKIDVFDITSYTQWIDQLSLFASIRKGMGEYESMSLSYIAQKELDDDKLDYEESGNIKTLPYNDYEKFVMYNIKDVYLLYKLEDKNDDLGLLTSISDITKTRLNKAMRKTVSLKNMAHHFYLEQGYTMGNNDNLTYGEEESEDKEKFEGAYVADPLLNGHNGILINGSKSKFIYDFVIDYDYTALYPSIIRCFNIDANCQYGRLVFLDSPPDYQYDKGGDFLDNLESKNIIYLTNKFLGTPTLSNILDRCKEEGLIVNE